MTKTALFTTAIVIIIAVYDLYAVATGGVESSVSRFIQDSGYDAPFLIFAMGYLCGHWFGFMKPACELEHKEKND